MVFRTYETKDLTNRGIPYISTYGDSIVLISYSDKLNPESLLNKHGPFVSSSFLYLCFVNLNAVVLVSVTV